MPEPIPYEAISDLLVERVPEIRKAYEALLRWWGEVEDDLEDDDEDEGPGPHVVYGDVLNPFLIALLILDERTPQEEECLRRIFELLEDLAHHPDVHVQEVVAFTVLERLGGDKEVLKRARPYMSEVTMQFSREVEAFWHGGTSG